MNKQFFACAAALLFASGALAQVSVQAPWIRASVPQAKATGAFMELQSAQDMRLVGVRSSVAGSAEMHQMELVGQTMKMHAVDGIDIGAGRPLNLASGGYHIMLMDLKRQLKEGDSVPLTLLLQAKDGKRQAIELKVPVKALTYVAPAAH